MNAIFQYRVLFNCIKKCYVIMTAIFVAAFSLLLSPKLKQMSSNSSIAAITTITVVSSRLAVSNVLLAHVVD